MADSDGSNSPPARAEQKAAISGEALAEIIAAQTQPANATHLSLPGSEYLASGDVHLSPSTLPDESTQASAPRGTRVYTRTVHLEAAHLRLQDILADTDDENAERYVVDENGEVVDDETMLLEREVYVTRETMAIKWLRERHVPLLYDPQYLARVFKQPNRFAGMIRPFYLHPPLDFDAPENNFFERQCLRFEEFNRWQAHNRGIDTMQEEVMIKSYNAALVREATSAREWRELMANPALAHSAERQAEFWHRRREEKQLLHDDDCANFDEYRAGVRARLVRNGVEVAAGFALLVDFWAQDRLTMWTEYLAFEHWHMEQMSDDVTEWRARHDESYERLQQRTALRTHETAEYLPTPAAQTQRRIEKDRAFQQYDLAALEFARLQHRPRSRSHEQMFMSHICRTRMLAEAQVELEAAEAAKNAMLRHEEAVVQFLLETETYREACDIRARHEYLLAWAKDRYYEMRCEAGQLPPGRAPLVSFLSPRVTPAESATTSQRASVVPHPAGDRQAAAVEAGPSRDGEHRSGVSAFSEAPLFVGAMLTPPVPSAGVLQSPMLSSPPVPSPSTGTPAEEPPLGKTPQVEEPCVEEELSINEPSVEQPTVERSIVEQLRIKRILNTPSPVEQQKVASSRATRAEDVQEPPVSIVANETDGTPSLSAPPGPRRSARVAALRQKAAEKAALLLQSTQASDPLKNLPKPKGASRGGKKRGRGKVPAEEKDEEPPAKRLRPRTTKK